MRFIGFKAIFLVLIANLISSCAIRPASYTEQTYAKVVSVGKVDRLGAESQMPVMLPINGMMVTFNIGTIGREKLYSLERKDGKVIVILSPKKLKIGRCVVVAHQPLSNSESSEYNFVEGMTNRSSKCNW